MKIALPPAAVDTILRDACHAALTGEAPVIQSQTLTRLRFEQLARDCQGMGSAAPRARRPSALVTVEWLPGSDVAVITPTLAGVRYAARLFYDAQSRERTPYVWRAQGGQRGLCWQTQEQTRAWIFGDEPKPWGDVCGHIWIKAVSRRAYVYYIESLYERASASECAPPETKE